VNSFPSGTKFFKKMKSKTIYIFVILIIVSGFFILMNISLPNNSQEATDSTIRLQTELVCMVNDAYMGIKQFPVPVENKMYYGCCEQCVDKIKDNENIRYTKDPFTGEKVDKALAFIVMKSEADRSVYYFKSKDNYLQYLKTLN
jgi:YHS domain-containing protein